MGVVVRARWGPYVFGETVERETGRSYFLLFSHGRPVLGSYDRDRIETAFLARVRRELVRRYGWAAEAAERRETNE